MKDALSVETPTVRFKAVLLVIAVLAAAVLALMVTTRTMPLTPEAEEAAAALLKFQRREGTTVQATVFSPDSRKNFWVIRNWVVQQLPDSACDHKRHRLDFVPSSVFWWPEYQRFLLAVQADHGDQFTMTIAASVPPLHARNDHGKVCADVSFNRGGRKRNLSWSQPVK